MIDLHTHTLYSDGTSSPELLLQDASRSGVSAIAITDHNSVQAYKHLEKIDAAYYFNGKIVKGIELTCFYNGKIIELLGYGIDVDKMNDFIEKNYSAQKLMQIRQREFDFLEEKYKNLGLTMVHVAADESQSFAIPFFINGIKKFPENKKFFSDEEWNSAQKFFRECVCNPSSPFYYDFSKSYLSVEAAADVIRSCGGITVLAHAWIYGFEDTMKEVETLHNMGVLDGIEALYYDFSQGQKEKLLAFCKEKNLIMTGGSDYHGKNRDTYIGTGKEGSLFVPDDLLNQFPESFYFKT